MPECSALDSVTVDPQRGHIALVVGRVAAGAFVDLGPELHWWSHTSLHLSPADAHELGTALVEWAAKRAARPSFPTMNGGSHCYGCGASVPAEPSATQHLPDCPHI